MTDLPTMSPGGWLRLDTGPGEAAFNMALDDVLLSGVADLARPVLRFYGWTEPAATFGYFQHVAEIEQATTLRPLIRRPTGGGLVPHDADWTYSVAVPPGHEWYGLSAIDSYARMHGWLAAALQSLGVPAVLSPECRREVPGQCFAGYEKADVLLQGRKIAGAAQRRNRDGLLIQGSLQPPRGLDRDAWQEAMLRMPVPGVGPDFNAWDLPAPLRERARALAAERYATDRHNRRR